MKIVGAVRFSAKFLKYAPYIRGGFIVVQVVQGGYEIYTAEDKLRAVIKIAGGVAGAAAGSAAVEAVGTPLLALGPYGWAGYGVSDLIGGGVGYFVGSKTATYIYDVEVKALPGGLSTLMKEVNDN